MTLNYFYPNITPLFGIRGAVLDWVRSFLTGRTQRVCYGGWIYTMRCPSGVCLRTPALLYTPQNCLISSSVMVSEPTVTLMTRRMYISVPATGISSTVQRFVQCMDDVSEWMARNQLKMNTEKTQLIWLRTSQQLRKVSVTELTLPSGLIQFVNSSHQPRTPH